MNDIPIITELLMKQERDYFLYQCVKAIEKLPDMRLKMVFSKPRMGYMDDSFNPSEYEAIKVRREYVEKKVL